MSDRYSKSKQLLARAEKSLADDGGVRVSPHGNWLVPAGHTRADLDQMLIAVREARVEGVVPPDQPAAARAV